MPKKYHIDVHPAPNRFPRIGRSGIVDWGEGCLKCAKCVKYSCIYNVYRERSFSTDIMADTIDELCKNCFRCVQGCPKRLIHKTINPEWEALGDELYNPETISITWEQAQTGKIPVSGAGYGGKFSGPGFDSMWTDMSEIVRPTRDGIHGREYISTVVELGRRPQSLQFDGEGRLLTRKPSSVRLPLPIFFDMFPFGDLSDNVWYAAAGAARELGAFLVVPQDVAPLLKHFGNSVVPFFSSGTIDLALAEGSSIVEVEDSQNILETVNYLKRANPDLVVAIRMKAQSRHELIEKIINYNRAEVDVIHYAADETGHEPKIGNGLHIKDVIREAHTALLQDGSRDRITFMVSGGIAMAEHVIKSILCGADLVGIDVPLLIAMECRVCRNCRDGGECPVDIAGIDPSWGSRRMINLVGAWHNQLLEMMGAMGIREARRLRGEQGRSMFLEDLENDTFAQIFGQRC
jgi:ferredoxin